MLPRHFTHRQMRWQALSPRVIHEKFLKEVSILMPSLKAFSTLLLSESMNGMALKLGFQIGMVRKKLVKA